MIRRRVACPCSRESDVMTDDERRAAGWRLVPASSSPYEAAPPVLRGDVFAWLAAGEVFVWVCPDDVAARNVRLRAGQGA